MCVCVHVCTCTEVCAHHAVCVCAYVQVNDEGVSMSSSAQIQKQDSTFGFCSGQLGKLSKVKGDNGICELPFWGEIMQ